MNSFYNPYIVGDPVEGSNFYGRHNLMNDLSFQKREVIHLLGTRRIGKTSLLKKLATSQKHAFYINLQRTGGDWHTLQRVLQKVVQRNHRQLNWISETVNLDQESVAEMLYTLNEHAEERGVKIWLLFDESEVLIDLGRSDIKALQKLQAALWNTPYVRTVFASAKQLSQLDEITTTDEYGTPFLNHFPPPVYINNLTDEETIQLIKQIQGVNPVSVPDHVLRVICQQTHNHPFYIQWICHFLWKENPDPSTWYIDESRFEITPDLYRMLHYDFSYLSMPERQIIHAVLRGYLFARC